MKEIEELHRHRDGGFDAGNFDSQKYGRLLESLGLERAHQQFIQAQNGIYAFDRALHIFGCSERFPFHHLQTRNAPSEWRNMYGDAASGLVFFAEDIFGNLYAKASEKVVLFDLETGERNEVASDFSTWVRYILQDTDYATGQSLAAEWQRLHDPLPYSSRLCPKKPFVVGGEFVVDNLYALAWDKGLLFRADIARQLRDLPDGTPIQFKIID